MAGTFTFLNRSFTMVESDGILQASRRPTVAEKPKEKLIETIRRPRKPGEPKPPTPPKEQIKK